MFKFFNQPTVKVGNETWKVKVSTYAGEANHLKKTVEIVSPSTGKHFWVGYLTEGNSPSIEMIQKEIDQKIQYWGLQYLPQEIWGPIAEDSQYWMEYFAAKVAKKFGTHEALVNPENLPAILNRSFKPQVLTHEEWVKRTCSDFTYWYNCYDDSIQYEIWDNAQCHTFTSNSVKKGEEFSLNINGRGPLVKYVLLQGGLICKL